jgi:hypothetical protein
MWIAGDFASSCGWRVSESLARSAAARVWRFPEVGDTAAATFRAEREVTGEEFSASVAELPHPAGS